MENVYPVLIGILLGLLYLDHKINDRCNKRRIEFLEMDRRFEERRDLQKKCVEGLVCPQCENKLVRKGDFYDWDDWSDDLKPDYRKGIRFCCQCTYTGLEEEFKVITEEE